MSLQLQCETINKHKIRSIVRMTESFTGKI